MCVCHGSCQDGPQEPLHFSFAAVMCQHSSAQVNLPRWNIPLPNYIGNILFIYYPWLFCNFNPSSISVWATECHCFFRIRLESTFHKHFEHKLCGNTHAYSLLHPMYIVVSSELEQVLCHTLFTVLVPSF